MTTVHPGVTGCASGNNIEPLAVSPKQACLLLGVGNTRLYQLIGKRELISYNEGRPRRFTMASTATGALGRHERHVRAPIEVNQGSLSLGRS